MTELTVTVLRYALLGLLWLFVLAVVAVLRSDLFGTRVVTRKAPNRATNSRAEQRFPTATPVPVTPPPPPPAPYRGAPRTLVVTAGPLTGTAIPLASAPILIGRSPECTLVLNDDYSSGRHLRLSPSEQGWVAEDLGSTNGTFLGRERLTAPTPVRAGSELRIGTTVLELKG